MKKLILLSCIATLSLITLETKCMKRSQTKRKGTRTRKNASTKTCKLKKNDSIVTILLKKAYDNTTKALELETFCVE